MAKYLEAFREAILFGPSVHRCSVIADLFTMGMAIIIDVIYRKELGLCFSAANALATIRFEHFCTLFFVVNSLVLLEFLRFFYRPFRSAFSHLLPTVFAASNTGFREFMVIYMTFFPGFHSEVFYRL